MANTLKSTYEGTKRSFANEFKVAKQPAPSQLRHWPKALDGSTSKGKSSGDSPEALLAVEVGLATIAVL